MGIIREATLQDVDDLLIVEEACFLELKEVNKNSFRNFINKNHTPLLVIELDDGICGYALALLRKNSKKARLYSLAILPNHQGKGFARRLLEALEQEVKKHQRSMMTLEVRQDNESGIRFYEKQGYAIFGSHLNYYQDGVAAWRMQKIL